jgi:integrase
MKTFEETESKPIELPRPPVAEDTQEMLENFEPLLAEDYEQFKVEFLEWLLTEGKDEYRREGYSESTVITTHYKVEETYRWLWERDEDYTKNLMPEDATELIDFLMKRTPHPDQYVATFEKSIRRLFRFLRDQKGRDIPEWEHDIPIDPSRGSGSARKDRFYPNEMNELYETALKTNSVKSYHNKNMSSRERENLKITLAQRFGKPKSEIAPEDFKRANSWKIPSMIAVTSDTGLRPIEVGRAKVSWMNLNRKVMVVPKDEATKNDDYWECKLSSKTVDALDHWLNERESYDLYDDHDELWLTRNGNPYNAQSLNPMLNKLLDVSSVNEQERSLSWYSFRHGVASMWAEEKGIYEARNQLRHKDIETTLRYTRNSGASRGKSAEGMW